MRGQLKQSSCGTRWVARNIRGTAVAVSTAVLAITAGCGLDKSQLIGIANVTPPMAVAKYGTPQNTVQFTAMGRYAVPGANCCDVLQVVKGAQWTTSDAVNTSIDKNGLATCLGLTVTPATITASVTNENGTHSNSAHLVCE